MGWRLKLLYALNSNGEKIEAKPNLKGKGICPSCNIKLITKCGAINIWHWSHYSYSICSFKGETYWHLKWKSYVKKEFCEVRVGKFIADIVHPMWVIELQNSPIDWWEIKKREQNYKKMIWLMNGEEFRQNFEFRQAKGNYRTFRWKWPRKSYQFITHKIFIDFDDYIFQIKKIFFKKYCGGGGYIFEKKEFMLAYFKPILKWESIGKPQWRVRQKGL